MSARHLTLLGFTSLNTSFLFIKFLLITGAIFSDQFHLKIDDFFRFTLRMGDFEVNKKNHKNLKEILEKKIL